VTSQDDSHLIGLKAKIRMLLHSILFDRTERAAKYIKLKETGDERRMPEDAPLTPLIILNEDAGLF